MHRTTVYLPGELKKQVEEVAKAEGCSEAEVMRQGIRSFVEHRGSVRPRVPLFASGDPTLSERVDEELAGFGEK